MNSSTVADGERDPSSTRNEQSGTVHGTSIQAGNIHGGVHIHHSDSGHVPRQLTRPPAHFTNRMRELSELDEVLADRQDQPNLVVVSGPGGIGKTALAARWLFQLRENFPDGQLHADLGAFGPSGPVATGEILGRFLRGLGVAPARVPFDEEEQAALYRSLTADKKLLVSLDDASSAAQVRSLLPSAPGSVVVVTSRRKLTTLFQDGAHFLNLEPFDRQDALRLLANTLGEQRISAEAQPAVVLVDLCGGLPIALSVAGARLATHPRRTLARAVTDLSNEQRRLAALSARENISVQATFDVSYNELPDEAARLYRTLGLHPGSEFGLGAAAAAAGVSEADVEDPLEELIDANLLEELDRDRYRFHDLVRLHALDQARKQDSKDERDQALRRVLEWYLRTAMATEFLVTADQEPIPYEFASAPASQVSFPSRDEALDWLELERTNLISATQTAAEHGFSELSWQLAAAMWPLFLLHKHYRDFLTVSQIGVSAAQAWGHRSAEALMRNRCGAACRGSGRFDEAIQHYSSALEVLRDNENREIAIRSWEGLGLVSLAQGELDAALDHFEEVLRRSRDLNRPHDEALTRINLGVTLGRIDRCAEGITHVEQARQILADEGDTYNHARALTDLGRLLGKDGQLTRAEEYLTEALATMRQLGTEFEEGRALEALGEVAELGGRDDARTHYEAALALFTKLGRPEAARLRERLN